MNVYYHIATRRKKHMWAYTRDTSRKLNFFKNNFFVAAMGKASQELLTKYKSHRALTCNMKLRIESNKDNRNRFNGFMTPPQCRQSDPLLYLSMWKMWIISRMVSALRNKSNRYALHNSPALTQSILNTHFTVSS